MSDPTILVIGDLHFGKVAIDHINMCNALMELFIPKIEHADMVVLNGDYFDTLLDLNSAYAIHAVSFFRNILAECAKSNTKIRAIRGTYLHDRDQCNIFEGLLKTHSGVDYKYYTAIDVEKVVLAGRTLYLGYLPDSLPYRDASKVVNIFTTKLSEIGISKLDTIFGHGTFEHTLPPNIPLPPCTYTVEMFKDITSLMVMNHIHIASHSKYVHYAGSFDRMSHGEEGDKGFISVSYSDIRYQVKFHRNPYATIFKTVDLSELSIQEATEQLLPWLDTHIPTDARAYVRVIHQDVEVRHALQTIITNNRPLTITTAVTPKSTVVESHTKEYKEKVRMFITPTEHNLPGLVHEYIQQYSELSKDVQLTLPRISELLGGI